MDADLIINSAAKHDIRNDDANRLDCTNLKAAGSLTVRYLTVFDEEDNEAAA